MGVQFAPRALDTFCLVPGSTLPAHLEAAVRRTGCSLGLEARCLPGLEPTLSTLAIATRHAILLRFEFERRVGGLPEPGAATYWELPAVLEQCITDPAVVKAVDGGDA